MHIAMEIVKRVAAIVVYPLQPLLVPQIHRQLPSLLQLIWSFGMLVLALSPHCPRKEM